MKIKNKEDVKTIEESLNKMMIAISYLKATGENFTDDWIFFPADEAELQTDYLINMIKFLREELMEE